ncbi:MAG: type II secretion system F family protein [Candidatus Nomurabacteria bacterium]|nr:type II secretion system F family protein [Candidatus Nomurabacteria bacterium]
MIFNYKAKSKTGEIFEGTTDAVDRFAVARELALQGNMPLSVTTELNQKKDVVNDLFQKIFGKVKMSEKIIFTRNLSGMLKAGLSLSRAVSVLEKQTQNPSFSFILSSIHKEIDKGESLSFGLAKFPKVFSSLFVSMVKAGEESGNLAGSLIEIGTNLEKSNSITKKVKGALMYPGVIMSVMVVIGILMLMFVVPTLSKTFTELGVDLPASTRFIINIGNLFSSHPFYLLLIVVGIVIGGFFFFKSKVMKPIFDKIILHLPAIGTLAKELNTARTARTLSSLISSGVPITRAIEITEDVVQNVYYKSILISAKESIEKGAPFSEIFKKHTELYPVMVGEMMEVGEETGKLADMLLEIALFYEEEIDNKTKNLSTIIEPILMVIIGAGVGFFAISMISPMYSIMDNIK